jgi:hypothetical protein
MLHCFNTWHITILMSLICCKTGTGKSLDFLHTLQTMCRALVLFRPFKQLLGRWFESTETSKNAVMESLCHQSKEDYRAVSDHLQNEWGEGIQRTWRRLYWVKDMQCCILSYGSYWLNKFVNFWNYVYNSFKFQHMLKDMQIKQLCIQTTASDVRVLWNPRVPQSKNKGSPRKPLFTLKIENIRHTKC